MTVLEPKTSDLYDKERIYNDVRNLMMQLDEADETEGTTAKRRANIEADRYLMANKSILLPIIADALAQQIRGIRDGYQAQLDTYTILCKYDNLVQSARLTEAEDMYEANVKAQVKKPLLARMFRRFDKAPQVQYATQDRQITADIDYTVKFTDGRYGLVVARYADSHKLEVKGPQGFFIADERDLLISIAPHTPAKKVLK